MMLKKKVTLYSVRYINWGDSEPKVKFFESLEAAKHFSCTHHADNPVCRTYLEGNARAIMEAAR